jgi:hypothetical protein
MNLLDLFKHHPFQNLTVAGQSTADFPLRGHEGFLGQRLDEIRDAIDQPDYPSTAQHTIVFGEWGHGKTHVLRTVEHKINTQFSQKAKAIFFEPTESDPRNVFQELCQKIGITACDSSEFIGELQGLYPGNIFLLIDETTAIVGEKISEHQEDILRGYWRLLSDLQQAASAKLYGLHVFHGLSANSASAIHRVGTIPQIRQFTRHIFSLKSLDEEEQWKMLDDHMQKALKQEMQTEEILLRGVNKCINVLTGGNPRFVLSLMARIFSRACSLGVERIDGSVCYQTLLDTQRLDASDQKYFNRLAISETLRQLKDGQQFEQKISDMLQQQLGAILGEWRGIDQDALASFDLTTANIRRQCVSLKDSIVIFEQPLGETHFRLTPDFLRLIEVRIQHTLTETDDKDLLLRLQLEPESLGSAMMIGLQKVMGYNELPGLSRPLQTDMPTKLYITNLGGSHLSQNIRVGLTVFKGDEIPPDLFEKLLIEIEEDRCTVIIIIEDAITNHDFPNSSYERFRNAYVGRIDIQRRLFFINGTDASGHQFDEDFFVRLAKTDIQSNEAKNWFDRLQINSRLNQITDDCMYCPDLNEQNLLNDLFNQDRSFKIGEIKDRDENFGWVNRDRLAKLHLYLEKTGSSYTARDMAQVAPFKFILGKLQSAEIGHSQVEIESALSAKYIRTGAAPSIQSHTNWALNLLMALNKVAEEDGKFSFKDLDRELVQLEKTYGQDIEAVNSVIEKYLTAQIDESALTDIQSVLEDISNRIASVALEGSVEIKIDEYQLNLYAVNELKEKLTNIPDIARANLRNQVSETRGQYEVLQQRFHWPYDGIDNPFESYYRLGEIQNGLEQLALYIKEEIPQQKRIRKEIQAINNRLSALDGLLNEELVSGIYEGSDIAACIFGIFKAMKDGKTTKVILHF